MDESSSSDATASERAQHEHTILSHMLTLFATPVRLSTKCHRNLLIKFYFVADLVEILVSTMAGNDRIGGFVSILRQVADSAKEGKSVDETLFNKTCTDAVTLLLSSQVSDQGCSDLLHLLCCCPSYISSSTSMKTGVSIWMRIFSEAPQAVSLVVAELINAWKWTRDNKRGLFACEMMPNAKLRPLIVPGEPLSLPMMDPIEEIVVHQLFLGFFVDHFEVIYNNSFELLLKMISETMKSKDHFSHHPAAAGTFFSLMFLVLKFCSWEMKKNKRNLGEELHLLEKMVFR